MKTVNINDASGVYTIHNRDADKWLSCVCVLECVFVSDSTVVVQIITERCKMRFHDGLMGQSDNSL